LSIELVVFSSPSCRFHMSPIHLYCTVSLRSHVILSHHSHHHFTSLKMCVKNKMFKIVFSKYLLSIHYIQLLFLEIWDRNDITKQLLFYQP
jgi:hypothetical protein